MRADRISLLLTYGIAAVGVAPAVMNVSPVFALALAVFVGLGLYWDLTDRSPLSSWLLTLLVILGLLGTLALPNPNGVLGRLLAGSILLLGGKLLAPKAARDMLQVMLLSLLLLIGSAILSTSMLFVPLFIVYLLLCTVTLLWIPFGTALERRPAPRVLLRRVGAVAGLLVAGSIPLLLVFFVALPRTPAALWRGVTPASTQVTGFSDRVSLGEVSRIARSSAVAFRAELGEGVGPLPAPPYWRGLVLEATDGYTWVVRPKDPRETVGRTLTPDDASAVIRQRIYLEPNGQSTLFALDRAQALDTLVQGGTELSDGALRTSRPVNRRIVYDVRSDPGHYLAWEPDPLTLDANLEVPNGLPPIVAETAAAVAGGRRDPLGKVDALVEYFHSGFTYSLESPAGDGHPLAVFLGETKTGYCEYFASALAFMLRTQGVPARLVAGYLGGDYNTTGDYYLVRQSSAHTWVEAYIAGRGWLRLDPTPPGQGPAASDPDSGPSDTFLVMDWLRLRWQALVLGYDLERQTAFFNALAAAVARPFSWRPSVDGFADLFALILFAAAGASLFALWRRGDRGDAETALYARLLRRLRRRGLRRGPTEGPLDFALRSAEALPDRAEVIGDVTRCYLDARYGSRRAAKDEIRRLERSTRRV